MGRVSRLISRRRAEIALLLVAGIVILLARREAWPFNAELPIGTPDSSVWSVLIRDRLTLGFVRLALLASALYVVGSIAVRSAHNQWLTKLGPTEVGRAELDRAAQTIDDLQTLVSQLTEERDGYRSLLEEETAPGEATGVERGADA